MRPVIRGVRDLRPVTDVPDGVSCWQGVADDITVTFVVEAPATAADFDSDAIEANLLQLQHHLEAAAQAITQRHNITPSAPELTFWPGPEWMIRYADCDDHDLGIAVTLSGSDIIEMDDLDDVETADEA